MAFDFTQLNAVTQDVIRPKLIDNIFTDYPLLARLKARENVNVDGGTQIQQPIIYAKKNSVGSYSGWDPVLTAVNDSLNAVFYTWGHYYCQMGIPWTDELANSGKSKIVSLLDSESKVAEMTLTDKIGSDLFAASLVNTNDVNPLTLMVSTTDEHGGISSSDWSGWASSVDTSTTVMTLGALKVGFGAVTYGNRKPTLIVTAQNLADKYWQLLEVKPEFRVQDANGNLKFEGATWLVDRNCTAAYLYMLNENFLEFYIHPQDNFKIWPWEKPSNQFGRTAQITASIQLGTSNRRMHKKFTALDYTL